MSSIKTVLESQVQLLSTNPPVVVFGGEKYIAIRESSLTHDDIDRYNVGTVFEVHFSPGILPRDRCRLTTFIPYKYRS